MQATVPAVAARRAVPPCRHTAATAAATSPSSIAAAAQATRRAPAHPPAAAALSATPPLLLQPLKPLKQRRRLKCGTSSCRCHSWPRAARQGDAGDAAGAAVLDRAVDEARLRPPHHAAARPAPMLLAALAHEAGQDVVVLAREPLVATRRLARHLAFDRDGGVGAGPAGPSVIALPVRPSSQAAAIL